VQLAMIGLGKMGANMTTRLLRGGHRVVAYDVNEQALTAAQAAGALGARSLDEVAAKLSAPRATFRCTSAGRWRTSRPFSQMTSRSSLPRPCRSSPAARLLSPVRAGACVKSRPRPPPTWAWSP
jgi:hypothetical protein